jgi:septum formation protein
MNPLHHLANRRVVLGSGSPRRRELLKAIWPDFDVVNINVSEDFPADMAYGEVAEFLARKKAMAYPDELTPSTLLITADTTVADAHGILNKPSDADDAFRMLCRLRGGLHTVFTGCCVRTETELQSFTVATEVAFAPISDDAIWHYIHEYRPMDKAGAYGIQEWIGMAYVTRIQGDYYSVMGLPVSQLYSTLLQLTEKP